MSRTIQLEQAEIAFDDIGAGDPVLLLHGFPATRHLWSQVAPILATAGFRVLVPDLAGYGASEAVATESVGMANQARWMVELLVACRRWCCGGSVMISCLLIPSPDHWRSSWGLH